MKGEREREREGTRASLLARPHGEISDYPAKRERMRVSYGNYGKLWNMYICIYLSLGCAYICAPVGRSSYHCGLVFCTCLFYPQI